MPTHFAKVILGSRPSHGFGGGDKKEYSIGAFVLPNEVIPDETPLRSFEVPGRVFHRHYDASTNLAPNLQWMPSRTHPA